MIKKLINTLMLLVTSGVVFHRCTLIGAFCAFWVVSGAADDENMFQRLLTFDLYLFMFAFVVFYRLVFKKTFNAHGDPDFQAMAVYTLGDFAWAVLAMFCVTFFLTSLMIGGKTTSYPQIQDPNVKALMKTRF